MPKRNLNLGGLYSRNLPYLKRDCDLACPHVSEVLLWSKPALLKKGLRLVYDKYSDWIRTFQSKPALLKKGLRQMTSLLLLLKVPWSKPALLKKGLRLFCLFLLRSTPLLLSKPALLKKGLRRVLFVTNHTHTISRNLPYLKRDCDTIFVSFSSTSNMFSRNLPYLKRDCDAFAFLNSVLQ